MRRFPSRLMNVVNLSRYPIHEALSTRKPNFADAARDDLANTGIAVFPSFINSEALASIVRDVKARSHLAHSTDDTHDAYQAKGMDPLLPPHHVRNMKMRTQQKCLAYADIPKHSMLRQLYEWDKMSEFISHVVGKPLHPLADPLGACSVNVFQPGQSHAWHFDETEYTMTLCLQDDEDPEGGRFEYTRPLRTSNTQYPHEAVRRIITATTEYTPTVLASEQGTCEEASARIYTSSFPPGTLQLFAGRYSLHRVTKVLGSRDRLVAVLCYSPETNFMNSPEVQKMFWGRVEQ